MNQKTAPLARPTLMTSLQGLVPRGLASAQALKIRVKGPGPRARVAPLHPSSWHLAQPPGPWQLRRPLLPGTKSRAFTGHLSRLCLREREPWACSGLWAARAHRGPGCPPLQASEDGESVGHCPSCQRLFMILLLKGVPFTLTTVDTRRSPEVLKDFAPGSQLPILLCDGDAKTDTLQIEEFLEETLGPPEFPSLAPRYRESTAAGNDVFHKFSAFIKNPVPAQDDALYQQLLRALAKLDSYLRAPLEHELGREPQLRESRRRFLDGDQLTLADCGLLPKLHVVNTVCAHFRQAPIPAELRGVRRYLDCALQEKEFKYTCPHSAEILAAYRPVVRPR
ncbi:chloride intracellular channel protein 3 isoform X1 [Bos javanicus]|uniref:chloride intracellular channel protein 3 isoform X1 n=1 Tax=Bos javanicus TaxID=9906 RepID=UPI002AA67AB6|nr:chloride intracellular channel protein 3 isoform X1 [Bos javanicus]